jgi:hypothetical protein
MFRLTRSIPLASLLFSAPVWAGDLTVVSTGAPVVVLRGGQVLGTTPFTLPDLNGGSMELGFRDAPMSATAFTQVVTVPETGGVRLEVNLAERVATSLAAAPSRPTQAPSAAPVGAPTPAGAPAVSGAPSAAPAAPAAPSGDIYVTSTPPGAAIFLDGAPVEAATPFVVRGVAVGKHAVEVRTACARAAASVSVANKAIARAELALVERPGALAVTGGAPNTRVLLDGVDAGKAPLSLPEVSCGQHSLAVRAPGYLEAKRDLNVQGYDTLNVVIVTDPAAPPTSVGPGPTVQMLLRKEEFGTLVLDVTPLETALAVDGIAVGAGPRSLEKIAAGPHTVSGELDGYTPASVDVTVEPDNLARVTLTLAPVGALPPPEAARSLGAAASIAKKPSSGRLAGRVALNVGVSAVGIGAGVYSATRFLAADEAYRRYLTLPTEQAAQAVYVNEVEPTRVQAWVGGGVGLLGILAATGLWITTDF